MTFPILWKVIKFHGSKPATSIYGTIYHQYSPNVSIYMHIYHTWSIWVINLQFWMVGIPHKNGNIQRGWLLKNASSVPWVKVNKKSTVPGAGLIAVIATWHLPWKKNDIPVHPLYILYIIYMCIYIYVYVHIFIPPFFLVTVNPHSQKLLQKQRSKRSCHSSKMAD